MRDAIATLTAGRDLTEEEAFAAMSLVLEGGATPAQTGAFLTALHMKGETAAEITGCARAMRRLARPVLPNRRDLVDISGTGGDQPGTFNISSVAAFVVAGAGVAVAKHGARSMSQRCGSADLLEALGVNLSLSPEQVAACIDTVGIGFLFAPLLHPALAHASRARAEIGLHTVFDVLGPLTNPASAPAQVVGVYSAALTELVAQALGALGSRAALVVAGADGMDEFSTTGVNKVSRLDSSGLSTFALDALELGLPRARVADLAGGTPQTNAAIARAILDGEKGPRRDIVLLNAAVTLLVAGLTSDLGEALALAAQAIDDGRARRKLEELIAFSRSFSG
ncbi:MAG: anthranilate phosphoribosyltransferase [Anaerolineae bacterium]|nr:anthranilate phosphoribosyltransferase [Anaerolineae bacterium]